jgi:hypothetical protein
LQPVANRWVQSSGRLLYFGSCRKANSHHSAEAPLEDRSDDFRYGSLTGPDLKHLLWEQIDVLELRFGDDLPTQVPSYAHSGAEVALPRLGGGRSAWRR